MAPNGHGESNPLFAQERLCGHSKYFLKGENETMKKNTMMRIASLLLVCVLLTTSVIGGTFAKYVTTNEAYDTARVAKWGVTIEATGDTAFAEKYDDEAKADGTKVVSSVLSTDTDEGQSVLAPGTNGSLGSITITGTPEVMVNVTATAELDLTGWSVDDAEYCPLVFTVGGTEYKIDATNDTIAKLETAVESAITNALTRTNVAANTDLAKDNAGSISCTWSWPFDGDNVKDTALGDTAATGTAPAISFRISATVTQVD